MTQLGPRAQEAGAQGQTLRRVAELLRSGVCRNHTERAVDAGVVFEPRADRVAALHTVECRHVDGRVEVIVEIGRSSTSPRMSVDTAWNLLAGLPEGAVVDSVETRDGVTSRRVRVPILAERPFTPLREVRISGVFEDLERRARQLATWSLPEQAAVLPRALGGLASRVSLVHPASPGSREEEDFVDSATAAMGAGPSTLSADDALSAEYSVALLASRWPGPVVMPRGAETSRGDLLEIGVEVSRHGGCLAAPVLGLSANLNPYDLGRGTSQLLRELAARQAVVLFYGVSADVSGTFAPQSVEPNPLLPIALRCPAAELEGLVAFAARQAAVALGLSPPEREETIRLVLSCLAPRPRREAVRVVGPVVRTVARLAARGSLVREEVERRIEALVGREEILGGARSRQPAPRSTSLTRRLMDGIASGALLEEHKRQIIGQDTALEQLHRQLEAQLRFGAPEKPLAVLMEGPPGVGKSASVELLASRLSMDMLYIDAASFGSHMQAHSLLLGSGLGVVNSYVPGKLEVASREQTVIEIADLDHAPDEVRGSVVELFLQLLDRGTFQTATGRTLSSSNMLLCFTCNLPEGEDAKVRRTTGFVRGALSESEIRERVQRRLSRLFSGAFLSRVGAPVVFSPLFEPARREIVRRLLDRAVRRTLRFPADGDAVAIRASAVDAVLARCVDGDRSFGVRRLAAFAHQALLPVYTYWKDPKAPDARWTLSGRSGVLTLTRRSSCKSTQ